MPPRQPERAGERRATERRPCHCPCVVCFDRKHLDGLAGRVSAPGEVRDISERGVGLLLRSAVRPGAMLAVDPLGRDGSPLPPTRVVRCVPVGRYWHHGCTWDGRLTAEELGDWLT